MNEQERSEAEVRNEIRRLFRQLEAGTQVVLRDCIPMNYEIIRINLDRLVRAMRVEGEPVVVKKGMTGVSGGAEGEFTLSNGAPRRFRFEMDGTDGEDASPKRGTI